MAVVDRFRDLDDEAFRLFVLSVFWCLEQGRPEISFAEFRGTGLPWGAAARHLIERGYWQRRTVGFAVDLERLRPVIDAMRELAPSTDLDSFSLFWRAYPRKEARKKALAVWSRLGLGRRELPGILDALAAQKSSEQWREAKFIPYPASWLNGRRWEDEKADPRRKRRAVLERVEAELSARNGRTGARPHRGS